MTTTGNEELVSIQPKHLKLMKFHLSQYLDLLCEQAEAGEKVKEINEIGLLDHVIDTLLGCIAMTPADYIASLPHGESKAAALQVYNLMRLVWITSQPNRMTPTKKDVAEEAQS